MTTDPRLAPLAAALDETPDWCGHALSSAFVAARAQTVGYEIGKAEGDAEIARLRAIEEAARAYLRHDGSGIKRTDQWAGDWDAMAASSARHALRAALEAER